MTPPPESSVTRTMPVSIILAFFLTFIVSSLMDEWSHMDFMGIHSFYIMEMSKPYSLML